MLSYKKAKEYVNYKGIGSRREYRFLRKTNDYAKNNLPVNPESFMPWANKWISFDEFLRNEKLLTKDHINIIEHYYSFENNVYRLTHKLTKIKARTFKSGRVIFEINKRKQRVNLNLKK